MIPSFARLGLGLATGVALSTFVTSTAAQAPGSFEVVGDTLVSAMMMFVGNDEKVYIIDKAEANPTQIDDHPAWGTVWDIKSRKATPMTMFTNSFCAAGLSMPNGSFAVFGGNAPVGPDGNTPKVNGKTVQDPTYKDYDGRKAIRILDPCTGDSAQFGDKCVWHDDVRKLAMQQERWYPGVESLPNGDAVIIGGMKSGGYVNRNWPDTDPGRSGGGAVPTFEFFPSRGNATVMQLMIDTSGLNTYVHTYLMPSGLMFVQSYLKTILWDYEKNEEHKLPDMPNGIVRVYPGSAGVAMLPLTPKNGYTPTILFCGGSDLKDADWGNYTGPAVDTWDHLASKDCQRITPEPVDKSDPKYEKDDEMIEGRTMGQFIILPNGKLLMLNGATNGTAGYTTAGTPNTPADKMPFGAGLASGPTLQPAIYDPEAPAGKRWSNDGLEASTIARMYHSSALLLPDGSVFIAGSNPEGEYRPNATFPTEYRAEVFYPPYWNQTRPVFQGLPQSLTYGGKPFDIKIDATSYSGDSNAAAQSATAVIVRPGFSTHAMNMGQRFMQLNSTFSVADDGTITLHVSQLLTNANLVTPGPVLFFVNVNGVPSVGKTVIVGSGVIQKQEMLEQTVLPASILATNGVTGKAASSNSESSQTDSERTESTSSKGLTIGAIVGIAVGGVLALIALVTLIAICARRRKAAAVQKPGLAKNITIVRGRPGTTLGYKDFSGSSGPQMVSAFPPLGRQSPVGPGSGASPLLAAGFAYPGREGASSPDSVYSASTRLSVDPLARR